MKSELPTEFRGVTWDDGWEYDAPCVVYKPVVLYRPGGNAGEIEGMVEDYCIGLSLGDKPRAPGLNRFSAKEFAWRGWTLRGMSRRRNASHVVIKVRWKKDDDGELAFEFTSVKETWGPSRSKNENL